MTEENTEETTEGPGPTEGPAPQIGLRDIAFAVEVLKVASRRGAFELNELKSVGELGERFSAFVEGNKPESSDLSEVGPDRPGSAASADAGDQPPGEPTPGDDGPSYDPAVCDADGEIQECQCN